MLGQHMQSSLSAALAGAVSTATNYSLMMDQRKFIRVQAVRNGRLHGLCLLWWSISSTAVLEVLP
jgi:hypothetical protein